MRRLRGSDWKVPQVPAGPGPGGRRVPPLPQRQLQDLRRCVHAGKACARQRASQCTRPHAAMPRIMRLRSQLAPTPAGAAGMASNCCPSPAAAAGDLGVCTACRQPDNLPTKGYFLDAAGNCTQARTAPQPASGWASLQAAQLLGCVMLCKSYNHALPSPRLPSPPCSAPRAASSAT